MKDKLLQVKGRSEKGKGNGKVGCLERRTEKIVPEEQRTRIGRAI